MPFLIFFFLVCSDVGVIIADFAIRGFTHKHVQWKHHCSNVCGDLFSSRGFMRSGLSSIFQCTALSLSMMVVGGWMWMGVGVGVFFFFLAGIVRKWTMRFLLFFVLHAVM